MIVIRRNPINRLSKLLRSPGGPTVTDALAAAQANLEAVRYDCLVAMDAKLAQIAEIGVRCRQKASDEDVQALYDLGNDVLEVAGVFELDALGQAAQSLCELMDRCRTFNTWSPKALDVHLNGLMALRALGGKGGALNDEVLDGLRKVVERVGRGGGGEAA